MQARLSVSLVLLAVLASVLLRPSSATVVPHIGKAIPRTAPIVQLNLDLPPEQRWTGIALAFKDQLWQAYAELNWLIPHTLEPLFQVISFWGKYVFKYQEMSREIQSIAEATSIPFGKLFFVNFMYEFSTIHIPLRMCTSTVIRNASNHILHGRNMDFYLWNRISALEARVQYYRAGKYVASVDQYVGAVWAITTFKPKAFSITVDTRFPRKEDESFKEIMKNVFVRQFEPSAWLVRRVLLNEPDFASARQQLLSNNVTSPIYYIIAGLQGNEGTVIEKQPVGVHAYWDLNETMWYLVQTNYDRDAKEPVYDQRRVPAERRISEIGQSITIEQVFDNVMTQWPTFNIGTVMTLLSVPSLGYSSSVVWYPTANSTNSEQ